nr:hypothetical protein [Tanacetum cinerariifolium]
TGDDVDINTLTLEQYLALIQDNIRPGIVKPKIKDNVEFKINGNFMKELRRKLLNGIDDEDGRKNHDLNNQQKVHIFYTGLDIPTRIMLDSKGFIPLMTPTQTFKLIQVMKDHSHNWYDVAITKERIKDFSDNIDTKKLIENIHVIQVSCKICEMEHLSKECPLKKEDKAVEQRGKVKEKTKMGEKDMKEPVPRNLPVVQPYVPPT